MEVCRINVGREIHWTLWSTLGLKCKVIVDHQCTSSRSSFTNSYTKFNSISSLSVFSTLHLLNWRRVTTPTCLVAIHSYRWLHKGRSHVVLSECTVCVPVHQPKHEQVGQLLSRLLRTAAVDKSDINCQPFRSRSPRNNTAIIFPHNCHSFNKYIGRQLFVHELWLPGITLLGVPVTWQRARRKESIKVPSWFVIWQSMYWMK